MVVINFNLYPALSTAEAHMSTAQLGVMPSPMSIAAKDCLPPGEAVRGSVETIERPRPRANGSSRPKAVARAVPRWRWYNFLPDRAAGCEETEPFDGRENRSATSLWRLHIPTVERERFDPLCGSRPPSTRLGSDRQRDKAWFRAVYSRRAYSGEGRGIGGPPGQPHTLSRSR